MVKNKNMVKITFASFDDEDYKVENLKYIMDNVIDSLVKNIYHILSIHPVFRSNNKSRKLKKKFNDPKTFDDYKNNLVATVDYLTSMDKGYNIFSKSKIKKIQDVVIIRNDFLEMLKEAIVFINCAIELREVNSNNNTHNYIKNVNKFSNSMINNILKIAQLAGHESVTSERIEDGFKNIFRDLVEYFKVNIDLAKMVIDSERIIRKESEKIKQEAAMIDEKRKAIHSEPNEKEILRLKTIKKANDKYEEFCLDFMRDLEKQVPLSTRDMYKVFINEKFARFQKQFNMPLDNTVSEGFAKEAMHQIELMIEYISKISENSYVTSVYKNQ